MSEAGIEPAIAEERLKPPGHPDTEEACPSRVSIAANALALSSVACGVGGRDSTSHDLCDVRVPSRLRWLLSRELVVLAVTYALRCVVSYRMSSRPLRAPVERSASVRSTLGGGLFRVRHVLTKRLVSDAGN